VAGVALLLALAARPAAATFHLIMIVEVFVGSAVAPDAQYVVLQMYAADQTNLGSHPMRLFDAQGAPIGTASFGTISNGADDANILIATATAESLFGVAADLRVPAKLIAAGGKVCFDTVDCFSWGNYSIDDGITGTPFSEFADDTAAQRIYTLPLDALDDTNDSEADFAPDADAFPRNNAGATGAMNPDALFLDGFEDGGFTGWSDIQPHP
jgi:hypothetical protein